MWDPRSSVDLGTHDLSAHNLLVDGEKTIQLLDGRGLAGRVDDDVDAFRLLLNVVSETTLAPHVDIVDGALLVSDDLQVLLHEGIDLTLFDLATIPSLAHLSRAIAATLRTHFRCSRGEPAKARARALALAVAWPLGQYLGARAADRGAALTKRAGV